MDGPGGQRVTGAPGPLARAGVRGAGRWALVGARVGREAISGYPPSEVFSRGAAGAGGTAKVQRRSKAVSS